MILLWLIIIYGALVSSSGIEEGSTEIGAINWRNPPMKECFDDDIFEIHHFKTFCEQVCGWRSGRQKTIECVLDYLSNGDGLPGIMDERLRIGVYKLIRRMTRNPTEINVGLRTGLMWLENKIVLEAVEEPEMFIKLLFVIAKENGVPRYRLLERLTRTVPRDKLIEFKKFEAFQLKIIATLSGCWTVTTLTVMVQYEEMNMKELTLAFMTVYLAHYLVFFYFYGNYQRINLPYLEKNE